ncbi:hypothetical protein PCE1_002065 [Barthelona sp. PCE]
MDRIYSAEQITVPPELPEIIKSFSMEVIRNQPSDLLRFCCNYWSRLANISLDQDAFVEFPSDVSPQQLIKFRNACEQLDLSKSGYLSQEQVFRCAQNCDISIATIENVAAYAGFVDVNRVLYVEFLVLCLGLAATDLISVFELIFTVFTKDPATGALSKEEFLGLITHLSRKDENIGQEFLVSLIKELPNDKDAWITFKDIIVLNCIKNLIAESAN